MVLPIFKVDMKGLVRYKDMGDYRYWLQQTQMIMQHPEDWLSVFEYTAIALTKLPLSTILLYNFACSCERLGFFNEALTFFQFCLELIPRWSNALFGKAVIMFKRGNYKESKKCIKVAIKNYKEDTLIELNYLIYFRAMCYKRLHKFSKARRDYFILGKIFDAYENQHMIEPVMHMILLALEEDRNIQHEIGNHTVQFIKYWAKS